MKDSLERPLSDFSPKDRNAIKGALRRAFARSEIHRSVEDAFRIEHSDPSRPRCKKWSWCAECGEVVPTWTTEVDHKEPVVPLDRTLEQMTLEELVRRIWCAITNLWVLCGRCHDAKTAAERTLRPKPIRKKQCR